MYICTCVLLHFDFISLCMFCLHFLNTKLRMFSPFPKRFYTSEILHNATHSPNAMPLIAIATNTYIVVDHGNFLPTPNSNNMSGNCGDSFAA